MAGRRSSNSYRKTNGPGLETSQSWLELLDPVNVIKNPIEAEKPSFFGSQNK